MARPRKSSSSPARKRRARHGVRRTRRNVAAFERAQFYEQKVDGGELYFLPLDKLKNGAWRGLLVRRYARAERAIKTSLGSMQARLWTHVAKVPAEVETRFGDAGNLGTMSPHRNRGRRRNNEDGMTLAENLRQAENAIRSAKRDYEPGDPQRKHIIGSAEHYARAALAKVNTHAEEMRVRKVLTRIADLRAGDRPEGLATKAKRVGGKAVSRSKQALRRLAHAASKAWS